MLPKTLIKQQFPAVNKFVDAKRTVSITVTPKDVSSGRKKDPETCALAKACVRSGLADAAIIGLRSSYLVKGSVATRYITSQAVSREITSFDRGSDFEPGTNYKLSKVSPSNRLDAKRSGRNKSKKFDRTLSMEVHHTDNVRIFRKYHK